MTIVEFLEARIAEDEEAARAAGLRSDEWFGTGGGVLGGPFPAPRTGTHIIVHDEGDPTPSESVHIGRHDPARVLRECAAKRKLVEFYGGMAEKWPNNDYMMWRLVLGTLAAVYSDHPDFDPEWRMTSM